jgi:hypothetical protein
MENEMLRHLIRENQYNYETAINDFDFDDCGSNCVSADR